MNTEFNDWWDKDLLTEDNPYVEGTPVYWAWEGWSAGVKAERRACAKVCDESTLRFHALWEKFEYPEDQSMSISASQCAAAIRERGRYD